MSDFLRTLARSIIAVRVRLWLIALVCVACALVSRAVFAAYAPPNSRAEAFAEWSFQNLWYTAALVFGLLHLWQLGNSRRPSREVPGCGVALLWVVALVGVYIVLVWSSIPGD